MIQSTYLLKQEWIIYQNFSLLASQAKMRPEYPDIKNISWKEAPVVPIIDSINSANFGLVLLKPKLKNASRQAMKEMITKQGGQLTALQYEALEQIYKFSKAIWLASNKKFNFDINPSNLAWVDDPAELASIHYQKPGFVFVEIGEYLNDRFINDKTNSEQFARDVLKYFN